jgi:hypothetical protein
LPELFGKTGTPLREQKRRGKLTLPLEVNLVEKNHR